MRLNEVEVDCDETKYLLDEHVNNERQLYSQANEVMQKLETSKRDASALISKVDKLREVMNVNQSAVHSYANQTVQSMDQMSREEIEAQAGNELLVDSLVQSVNKEKTIVTELVENQVKPELNRFDQEQVCYFFLKIYLKRYFD